MRSYSHLNTAKRIIDTYNGSVPFAAWLKEFFRSDKKFGSKDRKQIGHACYCYYRLGRAFQEKEWEERILIALYLCSNSANQILEEQRPVWNGTVSVSLNEKIHTLAGESEVENIFPYPDQLSREIDLNNFSQSFLIQPDLYLRIRPGKKSKVLRQLESAGIEFVLTGDDCVQFSNQSKIDEVLDIDEDVVVQDYNSQKTIDLLDEHLSSESKLSVWDCCAASGGKSILVHDHYTKAGLIVSDVRESILVNLKKRFRRAGIEDYTSFVADVSLPKTKTPKNIDVVICDAPCSGSGTWSRTPEQLSYFRADKIDYYADLQKKIVTNAVKALKPGGYFLYITCSVFQEENEEVVEFIEANCQLKLILMQYLKGYDRKADTLFAALFLAL